MLVISHLNIHLVSRFYQFFLEHIILTKNTTKKNVCDDVKKVREKAAVGGGRRQRLWCFAIHSSARDEDDDVDFKENVCLPPHGTQKKITCVLLSFPSQRLLENVHKTLYTGHSKRRRINFQLDELKLYLHFSHFIFHLKFMSSPLAKLLFASWLLAFCLLSIVILYLVLDFFISLIFTYLLLIFHLNLCVRDALARLKIS